MRTMEASRRLTWGRPHNDRQPLEVKWRTVATVSGRNCGIVGPLLDDKTVSKNATAEEAYTRCI